MYKLLPVQCLRKHVQRRVLRGQFVPWTFCKIQQIWTTSIFRSTSNPLYKAAITSPSACQGSSKLFSRAFLRGHHPIWSSSLRDGWTQAKSSVTHTVRHKADHHRCCFVVCGSDWCGWVPAHLRMFSSVSLGQTERGCWAAGNDSAEDILYVPAAYDFKTIKYDPANWTR